jgi:hypothetical protein
LYKISIIIRNVRDRETHALLPDVLLSWQDNGMTWWHDLDPLKKLIVVIAIVLCGLLLYALFAPVGRGVSGVDLLASST